MAIALQLAPALLLSVLCRFGAILFSRIHCADHCSHVVSATQQGPPQTTRCWLVIQTEQHHRTIFESTCRSYEKGELYGRLASAAARGRMR